MVKVENIKRIATSREFSLYGMDIYNKLKVEGLTDKEFISYVLSRTERINKQLNLINE